MVMDMETWRFGGVWISCVHFSRGQMRLLAMDAIYRFSKDFKSRYFIPSDAVGNSFVHPLPPW